MKNINIITAEDLDKEWTSFLNTIPWNQEGLSIAETNRLFEIKRNAWMKRMSKAYDVDIDDVRKRYTH